jgi:hypothetical protein
VPEIQNWPEGEGIGAADDDEVAPEEGIVDVEVGVGVDEELDEDFLVPRPTPSPTARAMIARRRRINTIQNVRLFNPQIRFSGGGCAGL